jgi:hypothetical protein
MIFQIQALKPTIGAFNKGLDGMDLHPVLIAIFRV